jgi:hypothetical protein
MANSGSGQGIENFLGEALKVLIRELLTKWQAAAAKTATPVDDFIVGLLRTFLGL